jgi:hypothetical protein
MQKEWYQAIAEDYSQGFADFITFRSERKEEKMAFLDWFIMMATPKEQQKLMLDYIMEPLQNTLP